MKITYEINPDTDNGLTVFAYTNAEKMFDVLCQIKREILDWKKEFGGCKQKTPHEILDAFYAILQENNIPSDMLN